MLCMAMRVTAVQGPVKSMDWGLRGSPFTLGATLALAPARRCTSPKRSSDAQSELRSSDMRTAERCRETCGVIVDQSRENSEEQGWRLAHSHLRPSQGFKSAGGYALADTTMPGREADQATRTPGHGAAIGSVDGDRCLGRHLRGPSSQSARMLECHQNLS